MKGNYRIYTLALVVVLCVIVGVIFAMSTVRLESIYKTQTLSSIEETKKAFLKDTVNNLITDIEAMKTERLGYYATHVNETCARFNNMEGISESEFVTITKKYFEQQSLQTPWTVLMWDANQGIALINSVSLLIDTWDLALEQLNEDLAISKLVEYGPYQLILGVSKDQIDAEVEALIYKRIHTLSFSEDGYLWINKILNYEGGDDYAVRLIHPNMPETEGMFLSTNMTDIKGNYSYLIELTGIKAKGEVFNTYYFKKPNSEIIAQKLSYTKLYEPYDWAIGMGMYLDDLKSFTDETNAKSKALATKMITLLILTITVILLIGFGIQIHIEKKSYFNAKSELEKEANHDALTGIFNRRYGMTALESIFSAFKKHNVSSLIMMFDVDLFKDINDRYGHDFGDVTLIAITKEISNFIRTTDYFIRWGGDEFVIIFSGMHPDMAEMVNKKLLDVMANIVLDANGVSLTPTVSVGCSFFEATDQSPQEVIKRADAAMYQSKTTGRSRYTIL